MEGAGENELEMYELISIFFMRSVTLLNVYSDLSTEFNMYGCLRGALRAPQCAYRRLHTSLLDRLLVAGASHYLLDC